MDSPFVYEEPVEVADLVGRAEERESLVGRAVQARNSRLEGPRRYGKTSLIRAVLTDCRRETDATVEVNFLGCVTPADIAERIQRAYGRALQGPLRRWYDGLVRTWQPVVQLTPGGVGVQLTPSTTAGLLDRLALPRKIHERTGKVCVVAFDEFQEVARVDAALPGTFRSEIETHGPAAGYIFSGSHPGMMRELFADRRHAFFAQATPVEVGPLDPTRLADAVGSRFAAHGRDPGEMLGPLLDAAAGHPQRAMLLAHHLFCACAPGSVADIEHWEAALTAAHRDAEAELTVLWSACNSTQRRVLKAVAGNDVRLTSAAARQRYGLPKSGSVAGSAEHLAGEGHLIGDATRPSGYRTADPFLAAWLAEDGR